MVVWWLANSPLSETVPGWFPGWCLSVWSLHFLPVGSLWVIQLPLTAKKMHVRFIDDSKFDPSVCMSVSGWLLPCNGLMTCTECPPPLTTDSQDRHLDPRDPKPLSLVGVGNY